MAKVKGTLVSGGSQMCEMRSWTRSVAARLDQGNLPIIVGIWRV